MFLKIRLLFVISCCCISSIWAKPLLINSTGEFSHALSSWQVQPTGHKGAQVVKSAAETMIVLTPNRSNFGINSGYINLPNGESNQYQLKFKAKVPIAIKGIFACSIKLFNKQGKELKQLFPVGSKQFPAGSKWRSYKVNIGKSTRFPFPAESVKMLVRFSFWNRQNSCTGKVMLKNISLTTSDRKSTAIAGDSITVTVGKLQVRFDRHTYWNIGGIVYRNHKLGVDAPGTYYGAVANLPKLGFIGSGHKSSGLSEQLDKIDFFVDGKRVTTPGSNYKCKNFKVERHSSINGLKLMNEITISDEKIFESVTISSTQNTRLNYIYLFMHPWSTDFYAYSTLEQKPAIRGKFADDMEQKIARQVRATVIYSRKLGIGVVTYMLRQSPATKWKVQYWDVKNRYRKFYCQALNEVTLTPSQQYHFELVTAPFAATETNWTQQAEQLLNYIKQ